MQFRSPPPLPTIFLIGRDLAKMRGGKRAQITLMIRSCVNFSTARVTTGFRPGTPLKALWLSSPFLVTALREMVLQQLTSMRGLPNAA
jgi:hypothetical protein